MARVMMFVDSDNLHFASKDLGFSVDPGKLKKFAERYGNLIQWRYYIYMHHDVSGGKARFVKALMHLQYVVIQKQVKSIRQEDGSTKYKAALDMRIAIDALLLVDHYDIIILVSGDSDFIDLINVLHAKGKRVVIFSSDNMVATEMRESVGSDYLNIATVRRELKKDNGEALE